MTQSPSRVADVGCYNNDVTDVLIVADIQIKKFSFNQFFAQSSIVKKA